MFFFGNEYWYIISVQLWTFGVRGLLSFVTSSFHQLLLLSFNFSACFFLKFIDFSIFRYDWNYFTEFLAAKKSYLDKRALLTFCRFFSWDKGNQVLLLLQCAQKMYQPVRGLNQTKIRINFSFVQVGLGQPEERGK